MKIRSLPPGQREIIAMLEDTMADPEIVKGSIESLSEDEFADIIDGLADHIDVLETAKAMNDQRAKEFMQKRDEYALCAQNERAIVEKLLRLHGDRKVRTAYYSVSIQKNGGLAPVEIDGSIKDIPEEYLLHQEPKPDRDKIRKLLQTEKVPWAHLGERGESLRIK